MALLSARGPEVELLTRAADARRAERSGDDGHLRRLPEHQLHERLLLPLRLLRVLEGPAGRQPARPRLPAGRRRGRAALRRGLGSRRHRGLPAGRHPPRLHGHLVPRPRARDPRGAARPARARLLAARGLAGRRDRGLDAARLPRAVARRRARQPAGHRGRDPRRRGAQDPLPRQAAHAISGSRSCARRTPWACARRRRSCSGTSRRRSTRPATSSRSATCSARPAASPSSCRCRSCTRRRRSRSRGWRRHGPTFREAVVLHAAARLVLDRYVQNIQASWVKLGPDGARALLHAGVNDLGGTLMNESISRAAGASHGQECPPERMEQVIRAAGREPVQRTTLYGRRAAEPRGRVVRRGTARAGRSPALRRRRVAAPRPADPARVAEGVTRLGTSRGPWIPPTSPDRGIARLRQIPPPVGAGRATPGDDDAPDSQACDAPRARAADCHRRPAGRPRVCLRALRSEPREGGRSRAGRTGRSAHVHDRDPEPRHAGLGSRRGDRHAARAHDVRERHGWLHRGRRDHHLPARAPRGRTRPSRSP